MTRTFISKPVNYRSNVSEGLSVEAGPAHLTSPDGHENGVVIRCGRAIKLVIPAREAIRLANEIADSIEALERGTAA